MKLLILDGDDLIQYQNLKNKFVFLITKEKKVYHIDSSDGKMYLALSNLKNLGKVHKKIIKQQLTKKEK